MFDHRVAEQRRAFMARRATPQPVRGHAQMQTARSREHAAGAQKSCRRAAAGDSELDAVRWYTRDGAVGAGLGARAGRTRPRPKQQPAQARAKRDLCLLLHMAPARSIVRYKCSKQKVSFLELFEGHSDAYLTGSISLCACSVNCMRACRTKPIGKQHRPTDAPKGPDPPNYQSYRVIAVSQWHPGGTEEPRQRPGGARKK